MPKLICNLRNIKSICVYVHCTNCKYKLNFTNSNNSILEFRKTSIVLCPILYIESYFGRCWKHLCGIVRCKTQLLLTWPTRVHYWPIFDVDMEFHCLTHLFAVTATFRTAKIAWRRKRHREVAYGTKRYFDISNLFRVIHDDCDTRTNKLLRIKSPLP